jgi:hypothetical protein
MRLACQDLSNPVNIFENFAHRQKFFLMPGTFFLVERLGLDGGSAVGCSRHAGKAAASPLSVSVVEFGASVAARKSRQGNLPTASRRIAQ